MTEPNLKEFLENLKKVNEISKRAIDDLSNYLHNDKSDVLSRKKLVNDLSPLILSLIKETDVLKDCNEMFNISKDDQFGHSNEQDVAQESQQNFTQQNTDEFPEEPHGIVDKQQNESENVTDRTSNEVVAGVCDAVKTGSEKEGIVDKQQNESESVTEGTSNEVMAGVSADIETGSVKEEEKQFKPLLTIVDFSKLVDPRKLEFMNKQEGRDKKDTSIIVLSSSDDESSLKNIKGVTKQSQKSLSKATSKTKDTIAQKSSCASIEDIKFRCETYVKLFRVPCEEIEKYYSCSSKERSPRSLGRKNCDKSDDEPDSNYRNQKNNAEIQGASQLDNDDCSKKLGKIIGKKCTESNKDTPKRKKKVCHYSISSDSSDDEVLLRDIKHNEPADKERSCNDDICSSSETNDCAKSKLSENEEDNSATHTEKNSDHTCNERKNDESGSSSELETFGISNEEKSKLNECEKSPSSDKECSDTHTTPDDIEDTVHKNDKKDEEKGITVSSSDSNDSDVDTFFRKNKFVKKRTKIESSSDSDEDKKEKERSKESRKQTSSSDNVSDKEDLINKRKRRRIKQMEDNSSESDGAVTRKKLKKISSVSNQTKKAAAEERERKQRILDKQKKYNQIYEGTEISSSKVEKLVLDVDEKTDKALLEVDRKIVSKLKPHQASGIQFMWDACFESLERTKKSKGSGCILAHCMGLGKTLQVIALTATLLESEETQVKKVLIVTPLSTVLNWKAEFKNWLTGKESFDVYELVSIRSLSADRASCLREWHEAGGVMIISYAMFRNLSNETNRKVSKKFRTIFVESLVDPGPDLVVCDEGHLLKNEKTGLSIAMNKIKTRRRIVLTGTPLQNNLKEYYCMVQFVKPNLLGTYKEYLNRFVNPITNGQYTDSTQYDINIMRRRSHVLHKLLDGIVQRRDYSVLSPYLPPKYEYVLFLTLTEVQKKLYQHYMDHLAKKSEDNRTSYLFKDFQAFSRICFHPRVLLDKSNDDQLKYQSDEESIGSLKDFIDDDKSTTTPDSSDSESESDHSSKKKKRKTTKRITRAQKNNESIPVESESEVEELKEWWQQYCDGEELDNMAHSTKLMLLFEILKECEEIGDKVLLFSQSLYALNLIEYFLEKVDDATQNGDADKKTCGYTGSWSPGLDYFRLDGSTNCGLRTEWCDNFNNENNPRARLFLLSTRAGGLGINLVAANRVILFDVSWNPSSDVQSIYRVYRFGQLKPSYVYRFVTYGTMEMKIYERQVTKQAISKRVIDEQQIDRHYNQNDLAELYKFEQPDLEVRPTPLVPKDVLLGEMLQNHDDKIYKYHEHQSLLENKEDETLNEEERKAAWEEFENEKVERTKEDFIGKFSINTIQLALKYIIQRDNPTWNSHQILSIIPQLIQQLKLQLSVGDQTMYKRIAAEVKLHQDEYNRKRQMQYYQYQLQLAAQNQTQQSLFQRQFQMAMANRFPVPGVSTNPNPIHNLNPNDVVELN